MKKTFALAMAASLSLFTSAMAQEAAPDAALKPIPGWLTQSGIVTVSPSRKPIRASQLADREAIRETLTMYTIALDDGNSELLRSVLTEDAVTTVYVGSDTPRTQSVGREKVVEGFKRLFGMQKDQRRHAASNMIVQNLRGNNADLIAYAIVTRTRRAETLLAGVVVYSAKMVRAKDGVWKIAKLAIAVDAGEAVVKD
jgi:ketosteroid isomerase-like protein